MSIKRNRTPEPYNFAMFSSPDYPINFTSDTFRDNIHVFLQNCASPEDYKTDGMSVSCTYLLHKDKKISVPLFTIEENVEDPLNSSCIHCRYAGWSKKCLTMKTYHFIIPADESWSKHIDRVLDQRHLLHGLIHCNGFGHLICINGIQGGSKYLFGKEIMDLWDRICTNLRTRKITVLDASKKRSMDLRLLYGVAYGHPWFGRWGYTFCRGSLGVSEKNFARAIEFLSSTELDSLSGGDDILRRRNAELVQYFREISDAPVITLRDIFRTLLIVQRHAKKFMNYPTTSIAPNCETSDVETLPLPDVNVYEAINSLYEELLASGTLTEVTKTVLACRLFSKTWDSGTSGACLTSTITRLPYQRFVYGLLSNVRLKEIGLVDKGIVSATHETYTRDSEIRAVNSLMDAQITLFGEFHEEETKLQEKLKVAFDFLLKFEVFSFTLTAAAYLTSAITHAPCKCKAVIGLWLLSSILVLLVSLLFCYFKTRSMQLRVQAYNLKRSEFEANVRTTLKSYDEISYNDAQWAYGSEFVDADNISSMKKKASILTSYIKHTCLRYSLFLAFIHLFLAFLCTMIFNVVIPWIVFMYKCQ